MSKHMIYILSDSIGETAERVAQAAVSQFSEADVSMTRYSYIQTPSRIDGIVDEITDPNCIVVFTVILDTLREHLIRRCEQRGLRYVDIMSPLMNALTCSLGKNPINEPGNQHKLDDLYFKRIQAVEFAVKYDDGKDPRGVLLADCVLIGVSRTSKTPLSMYMAHKNIKVANIPLVPEVKVPDELFEVDPKKIFCLTNDKNVLNRIRRERLKELGLGSNSSYANVDRIEEELKFARQLAEKLGCTSINVAKKAIEETANIILRALGSI